MTLSSRQPSSIRFDAPRGWVQNTPKPVLAFDTSWTFPTLGGGSDGLLDISPAAGRHDLSMLEQTFVHALCGQAGLQD